MAWRSGGWDVSVNGPCTRPALHSTTLPRPNHPICHRGSSIRLLLHPSQSWLVARSRNDVFGRLLVHCSPLHQKFSVGSVRAFVALHSHRGAQPRKAQPRATELVYSACHESRQQCLHLGCHSIGTFILAETFQQLAVVQWQYQAKRQKRVQGS